MKRINIIGIHWCFLLLLFFCNDGFSQGFPVKQIDTIQLQTLTGKPTNTSVFSKKLLAVVYLSPECPLCANYTLVLNKLRQEFNADLDIVGIFAGKSYTSKDCILFKEKYDINFSLIADTSKNTVDLLKATVTPEVFLLNRKREVIYHGAIDNWAVDLGKQRSQATQHFMQNAVNHYLTGIPVAMKETKAVGCFINDF